MSSVFSKIRQAYHLFKEIDTDALERLAKKVDLPAVMKNVSALDDKQLNGLMKMLGGNARHKELPPIDADFYHLSHTLTDEERAIQLRVRAFMETEVQPIVNNYWLKAEFPFELIPKLAALNICGTTYKGYGCPGYSHLLEGILAMEMARVDVSMATFFGVQSGLAMGSIYLLGPRNKKMSGCLKCSK